MTIMKSLIVFLIGAHTCNAQFSPGQDLFTQGDDSPGKTASADIDGDGLSDVISQGRGAVPLIQWYKNMGGFLWDSPERIAFNNNGFSQFLLSDVDGDTDIDVLACAMNGHGLGCILNTGQGLFMDWDTLEHPHGEASSISVSDMDDDGDPDIVYSTADRWLAWMRNVGNGEFESAMTIDSVHRNVYEIHAADLNNDDHDDLVVLCLDNLLLYEGLGDGEFAAVPDTIASGELWRYGLVADLNNDGWCDLAIQKGTGDLVVACFINMTTLEFNRHDAFISTSDNVGSLGSSDINGDGYTDLLPGTTGDSTVVLINDGTGTGWEHMVLDTTRGSHDLSAADLDGDGDEDLVSSGNTFGQLLTAWDNLGLDSWAFRGYLPDMGLFDDMTSCDLDSDGIGDLLMSSSASRRIAWLQGLTGGAYAPLRIIKTVVPASKTIATDVNGDGSADLVVIAGDYLLWAPHTTPGEFAEFDTIQVAFSDFLDVIALDMDEDGDNDLVTGRDGFPSVYLESWVNDGTGVFALGPIGGPVGGTPGPRSFAAPDLNNDGAKDLIYAVVGRARFMINGGFGLGDYEEIPGLASVIAVGSGDIDGDGYLDLITASSTSAGLQWHSNDGTGHFSGGGPIHASSSPDVQPHAFDADGDGDIDVLAARSTGTVLFLNNGTGLFEENLVIDELGGLVLQLADDDTDGDMDVLRLQSNTIRRHENFFGSPFRMEGHVFVDSDGNGSFTPGDIDASWVPVSTTPLASLPLSDESGAYIIYADSGAYVVQPTLPMYWTSDPMSRPVALTADQPISTGNDFIISALLDTSNIVPGLARSGAPCEDTTSMWITFANHGTRIEHGSVVLILDNELVFVSSDPMPTVVSGNTFSWDFDSLLYFEVRTIHLAVQLPGIDVVGDTLVDHVSIIALDDVGDTTHVYSADQTRVHGCSFDPNDKQVSPTGTGEFGIIPISTDHLDYTIRFQNTGTDTAYSVVVQDHLDVPLDRSTVQVLGYSFPPTQVQVEQDGGLLVRFDNILLPDSGADFSGSQGFITLRIGLQEGLPNFTEITNSAGIYFDNNAAVVTNTTLNTLVDCDLFTATIGWIGIDLLEASDADSYQWFFNDDSIPGADQQQLETTEPGSYTVRVSSVYGCTAESEAYLFISTEVEEEHTLGVLVVPNPFNGAARLVFALPMTSKNTVEISDPNGRLVRTLVGNGMRELPLDGTGLSSGLYVARISEAGRYLRSVRLVVE